MALPPSILEAPGDAFGVPVTQHPGLHARVCHAKPKPRPARVAQFKPLARFGLRSRHLAVGQKGPCHCDPVPAPDVAPVSLGIAGDTKCLGINVCAFA